MSDLAQIMKKRLMRLKSGRTNHEDQWQQAHDLIWPDGGDFTYKRSPGEQRTERIYELAATLAVEKGASAMESWLTPRGARWHRLVASNDELQKDATVKRWLEDATDLLFRWREAPKSRFYGQIHEAWKSNLAYGNACLYVEELPEGGLRYRSMHIGSTYIEENHHGIVDTIFREYELTARAAVQRWGKMAPQAARDVLDEDPFAKHKYLTVVRPNEAHERGVKTSKAFEVLEIALDEEKILERGGMFELQYIWTRYTVNPDEVYGRGPASMVLPNIKSLQEMQKSFMRAGQKAADPMLLTVDDGVIGRGDKKIRSGAGSVMVGGLNAMGQRQIDVLDPGGRIDMTDAMMDKMRDTIHEAFFVQFFDILERDRPVMTATEVLERAKEKGTLLTPVIGRQQSELLGPLIEVELKAAMRQGALPEMPEALKEAAGAYEIEYESIATRMQKSDEILGIQRALEVMGPFIENDPGVLMTWKIPDTGRYVNDTLGVPSKLVNTEDEYNEEKSKREAMTEQAEVIDQMPKATGAMRDLAAIEGGNAA